MAKIRSSIKTDGKTDSLSFDKDGDDYVLVLHIQPHYNGIALSEKDVDKLLALIAAERKDSK
jgi:hypothetical protein